MHLVNFFKSEKMDEFGLEKIMSFLKEQAEQSTADTGNINHLRHRLLLFCDKLHYKEYGSEYVMNNIELPIRTIIDHEKKPWLKGKSAIGVVGQYASGKTTFINTLFNMGLPRNRDSNTALPTYIFYGEEAVYKAATHNGEIRNATKEFIELIDLRNDFPFSVFFEYIVVSSPKEFLKTLSVLDTPGFSNNKRDEEVAQKAISQCDTVFLCKKIAKGQADADVELPFIEKNLKGKALYLVLTYCDMCPNIKSITNELLTTLRNSGVNVKGIIYFGKKSKFIQRAIKSSGCIYDLQHFLDDNLMKFPKGEYDWNNLHNGYGHLCSILKNVWSPDWPDVSCFVFSGDWQGSSGTDVCVPDIVLLNGLISCILNDKDIVHKHSKDILLNSLSEIATTLNKDIKDLIKKREIQEHNLFQVEDNFTKKKNNADFYLDKLFYYSEEAEAIVNYRCSQVCYCSSTFKKLKPKVCHGLTNIARQSYRSINFNEIENYGKLKAENGKTNMEIARLSALSHELRGLMEDVKKL